MIRQPTTLDAMLAWHSAALRGPVDRHDWEPQCGWFKRKAVRGGPWLPVRVWLDQPIDPETGELAGDETIRAACLGREVDPYRLWLSLRPISRAEYEDIVKMHMEIDAMAAAGVPIDLTTTPIHPSRSLA